MKRTGQQNRALHLYYTLLAQELNAAGYTVQLVLKEKMEVDWTPSMVKELLWRPAQGAILEKKSTTELEKQKDIDTVYEHLNRHLSEKFGIHVPFPSHEIGYWESAPLAETSLSQCPTCKDYWDKPEDMVCSTCER